MNLRVIALIIYVSLQVKSSNLKTTALRRIDVDAIFYQGSKIKRKQFCISNKLPFHTKLCEIR